MVNNKKTVEELEKQIVQTRAALNAYKQYGLEPEYGIKLIFKGKNDARRIMRRVRPRILKSIPELGVGKSNQRSVNQVIEGDNLQAMASLYRKKGKIDFIIADPPYNTGKDFRYNDKWNEDPNDEGLGNVVLENDPERHTKWAKFMFPRIQVMKEMLKSNGVLAFCIDHRELFNVGKMLDEIFGEQNRIGIINWQKMFAPKAKTGISSATEYILVYVKKEKDSLGKLIHNYEQKSEFSNRDNDPVGLWRDQASNSQGVSYHRVYAIQNPFSGKIDYPPKGTQWRKANKKLMKNLLEKWGSKYEERDIKDECDKALLLKGALDPIKNDPSTDPVVIKASKIARSLYEKGNWPELIFLKGGLGKMRFKAYFSKVQQGIVPLTWWGPEEYKEPLWLGEVSWDGSQTGYTSTGKSEINKTLGREHGFDPIKPFTLFKKIIQLWCPPNGLVLDPFAGTGTTGHAVLDLNKETGAKRKFILIERGFNIKEENKEENNYCRILLQRRLKAVITGKWADGKEHDPLEGVFKFSKLEKKIDAQLLLKMERKEMIDAVIESYGGNSDEDIVKLNGRRNFKYLIAESKNKEGIYLIWEGNDKENNFTYQTYQKIVEESKKAELRAVFHVYARLNLYQNTNVRFWKIPDQILIDFGVDARSEPFNE